MKVFELSSEFFFEPKTALSNVYLKVTNQKCFLKIQDNNF